MSAKLGEFAVAERAGPGISRKQRLDAPETPRRSNDCTSFAIAASSWPSSSREVAQYAQIVDRVDVAGDDIGERADPRPIGRVFWQQRRLRIELVEIFDDRQ